MRLEDFWSKVKKTDSCWIWQGFRTMGYGQLCFGKKGERHYAHRFAWELTRGTIPAGICVLHHCDNKLCVNPEHLFLGSAKDNTLDMIAKGRHPIMGKVGEAHVNARLTEREVLEIRRSSLPRRILAKLYSVCPDYINQLKRGRKWAYLNMICF